MVRTSVGRCSHQVSQRSLLIRGGELYTLILASPFRYASILASQKKTEDGLRWLKKGKGISSLSFFGRSTPTPATEAGGEEEESKRVNHQMWIDVRALCADARTLGVELEGREAFKALKTLTGDGSAVAVSEAVV